MLTRIAYLVTASLYRQVNKGLENAQTHLFALQFSRNGDVFDPAVGR
jgi:hypothetical protein